MTVCVGTRHQSDQLLREGHLSEAAVAAGILHEGVAATVLLRIDRWICRRADYNVVISNGAATPLARSRNVPAAKLRVISDWLNLSAIAPTGGGPAWRTENGLADDELGFMFAGTMGPRVVSTSWWTSPRSFFQ